MRGTTASRGRHSIRPTIRGAFSGTVESGADLAYGTNKQKLGLIKVKGRPSVTYVMEGGYHFEGVLRSLDGKGRRDHERSLFVYKLNTDWTTSKGPDAEPGVYNEQIIKEANLDTLLEVYQGNIDFFFSFLPLVPVSSSLPVNLDLSLAISVSISSGLGGRRGP